MNIQLRYFTGTGNSLKVMNVMKESFTAANHSVEILKIKPGDSIPDCDLAGFCFPVYAFGIPRIARRYLKQLPRNKTKCKAFIIITAGDKDESGFSVMEASKYLTNKNYQIIYSDVVQMPINWIVAMNPPGKEEALRIINEGISQVRNAACEIINGQSKLHKFNIPTRYGRSGLYREYYLFKYLGLKNLWRTFRVNEACNGCRLCSKACPTSSIVFKTITPAWLSTCEQCMRCVNLCPEGAIYQKYSGSTTGRNRYLEPGLNPFRD